MEILKELQIQNEIFYYRENTTDLNCIKEVVNGKVYENKNANFFIEKGEDWHTFDRIIYCQK